MDTFISSFAKDTRHRARRLETKASVDKLIRKFLVTQVPYVSWKFVYPFVSDDMDVINFRAPNMLDSYQSGKKVPLEIYESLLGDKLSELPLIQEFQEFTGVPKEKAVFHFFTQTKFPLSSDVYEKVTTYKPSLEEHQLIRQISDLISEMTFPDTYVYYIAEEKPQPRELKPVHCPADKQLKIKVNEPKAWKVKNNPILKEYRRKEQIGALFPLHHLASQIIIKHVSPRESNRAISPILGKRQYAERIQAPQFENTSDVQEIYRLLHALPVEKVNFILQNPQTKAFINMDGKNYKKDGHQLVEDLFKFYADKNIELTKRQRAFKKEFPKLSSEIVNNLIDIYNLNSPR